MISPSKQCFMSVFTDITLNFSETLLTDPMSSWAAYYLVNIYRAPVGKADSQRLRAVPSPKHWDVINCYWCFFVIIV